jgi:Tol biopolymer transport system component
VPPAQPPADPAASGWQVAGSGGWVRPQAMPELVPPDERGWEPPAPPRRRSSPPLLAPLLAFLGLVVVAGGTVFAAQRLDLLSAAAAPTATAGFTTDPNATQEPIGTYDPSITDDPNATDGPNPDDTIAPTGPTPVPTAFVTPPPDQQATVAGTLLFGRGGDIWAVQGTSQTKVVESGEGDAIMPVWDPDGKTIYYVQRTVQRGMTPPWGKNTGRADAVTHMATDIMSVRADGSHKTREFRSMHKEGQGYWSTVAIQPDVMPDGKTLILVSDQGEVPSADVRIAGVVLSSMSTSGRNLKSLGVSSRENVYGDDLGHNDPDISPDGKRIAFTYADKGGGQGQGVPRIGIVKYPVKKAKPDLSPKSRAYANPDWSPDGRYLAAERVTADKRDVVILDPDTWEEVARLTTNGQSFAPVWSPNGDQIAYLHVDGLKVDVRIMTLEQGSTGFTLVKDQAVTVDGDVDPESAPAWFIPQDQRIPMPTRVPQPTDADATQTATDDAEVTQDATAEPEAEDTPPPAAGTDQPQ